MLRLNARPNVAHRYEVVVIAASAGGIPALGTLLAGLPHDFPLPIAVVQHRTASHPQMLAHVLGRRTALKVKFAEEGEALQPGTVYLAPHDLHMTVRRDRSIALVDGLKIRHVRSSANPLFASAALALQGRVIAVVLTGYDRDGTDGVQTVKGQGGIVIAQDKSTSVNFGMPRSAIESGAVEHILPLGKIAGELVRLAKAVRE
jgi:two-component system chemotaxis response regulator CheB